MDVAREVQISPWDALLYAVRLAAGRVMYVDAQLREATHANDGDMMAPAVKYWLHQSRLERTLMAKSAKAAIDAGVAERLVRQAELDGRIIAGALAAAIDALPGLSSSDRFTALSAGQRYLLELESGEALDVDGI